MRRINHPAQSRRVNEAHGRNPSEKLRFAAAQASTLSRQAFVDAVARSIANHDAYLAEYGSLSASVRAMNDPVGS